MPNLFERVCELVGKSDNDPLFKQLIEELREQPEMQERPNGKSRLFTFQEVQLGLVAHLVDQQWIIRGAGMSVKSGNLPDAILPKDGREAVRKKFGQHPISSEFKPNLNAWKDSYVLPEADLEFLFDADADTILFWRVSMKKTET